MQLCAFDRDYTHCRRFYTLLFTIFVWCWVSLDTFDFQLDLLFIFVADIQMNKHPYHLVDASPWPFTSSLGRLFLVRGLVSYMHRYGSFLFCLGLFLVLFSAAQWWRDVTREATFQGKHTIKVESGLRMGMLLFICSEVFFFLAFF